MVTRDIDSLTREELIEQLEDVQREASQLREALESRVVIEQAKGVLAERLAIPVGEAFNILRYAARSQRLKLHEIARRVVAEDQTPAPVVVALARASRVRAAAMRERSEAHQERRGELQKRLRDQRDRLAQGDEEPPEL